MFYLAAIAAIHFAASTALGGMTVLSAKTLLAIRRDLRARTPNSPARTG